MSQRANVWTRGYIGVRHRTDLPKGFQITCVDRESFHELTMLCTNTEHPFTPVKEFTGTRDECEQKADDWAKSIMN